MEQIDFQKIACPGIIVDTSGIWEKKATGARLTMKKGHSFSFDNECSEDFIYIRNGQVSIHFFEANGKSKCQMICCERTLINEANILSRFQMNKVLYHCDSDIEYFYFRKSFMQTLGNDIELLRNVAYSQTLKLMHTQVLLNAVSLRNKQELVCWFLMRLCASQGGGSSIVPPICQRQMTSLLGLNQRTFNRYINFLKEAGILSSFTKRCLAIADMARLCELSQPNG